MTKNNAPQQSVLARTARGAGWVIGWRMTTRLIGILNTLILARLLVPADFGLVALATTFSGAIDSLSAVGVDAALIRAPHPSRAMYDTGFTLNLMRGGLTGLIIAVCARPLAGFYGDPRLAPLLFVLAAGVLADGFENTGIVDFRRNLTFDKEFRLKVFPRLLSVLVTIACALAWRSYWALMAGIMAGRLSLLVQGYVMHPYRPRLSLAAWRDLASYSFWNWLIGVMWMVHDRVVNLSLGRILGPASLGVFLIGGEIAGLPSSEMVLPLARACFPGFAAVQQEGGDSGRAFLRIVSITTLISLPAGVGLALVAAPVIRLGFGPQWMAAVPVMRIFAILGVLSVFGIIGATLLSAHAHLRSIFFLALGGALVKLPVLIYFGLHFGLTGAALALGVVGLGEQAVMAAMVCRRYHLRAADIARAHWRPVLATAAMALVLGLAGLGWRAPPDAPWRLALSLCAAVGAGAAVYGASLLALWHLSGRPRGAETDLLGLLAPLATRLHRLHRFGKPTTPVN